MNDFYYKASHSPLSSTLISKLGLPKPPALARSRDQAGISLNGRCMMVGLANGYAFDHLATGMQDTNLELIAFDTQSAKALKLRLPPRGTQMLTESMDRIEKLSFDQLIFDATCLVSDSELKTIYQVIQKLAGRLNSQARILIAGSDSADLEAQSYAYQASLDGFVRSLAKELGSKGVSINLIRTSKAAAKHASFPVQAMLSHKTAYVTGQSLTINQAKPYKPSRVTAPLAGKIALVTGAAQGIGAETMALLKRDGAQVIGLDIPQQAEALGKLTETLSGSAITLDLSDPDAANKLLAEIGQHFGVIDIVVHNAGITRDKTFKKMPEHFWDQVISINLQRIMEIDAALIKAKALNDRGRIICISSISGIAGNFGQSNYASSKSGIAGYVSRKSLEIERDITINAVAPGFIETAMTNKIPMLTREFGRRLNAFSQGGLPTDVAETIALMCHPSAQNINGQLLRVCGQNIMGR